MSGEGYIQAPACDCRHPYVEAVVASVVEKVWRVARPRALGVYGSLGRGEGSVAGGDGQCRLLSDVEVAVLSTHALTARRLSRADTVLRASCPVEVTLTWLLPSRLRRVRASNWDLLPCRFTLEQYDLIHGLRVVRGPDLRSQSILARPPAAVHPWDGLRLIFNRVVEAIQCLCGPETSAERAALRQAKLMMASYDSVLIAAGAYDHRARLRLRHLEAHPYAVLPRGMVAPLSSAYAWKLDPDLAPRVDLPFGVVVSGIVAPCLLETWKAISGDRLDDLSEWLAVYRSFPHLAELCRVYPGRASLQAGVLLAKGRRPMGFGAGYRDLWREGHAVYAAAVEWIARHGACLERPLGELVAAGGAPLSADAVYEGQRIVSAWERVCIL